MSSKKIRWLVLVGLVTILLAGCKCDNAAVEAFILIADSPIGGEVVSSLTPTFDWHGSDTCDPDRYRIYISEDVEYGNDSAYGDVPYTDVPYTLTGDSLLPGRAYFWKGKAENDWSSGDPGATGEYSEPAYFFTGPVCSGETLIAPVLDYPRDPGGWEDTDNWITHDGLQDFHWIYEGGCLPVSYDYQFASDAGFTDIILSGTTTEPYVQHIYESFPNCSSTFWRVRANDGSSVGPWSDPKQFHWVREGTECYQTHYVSDEAARIYILLYSDECSQTGYNASAVAITDSGCKADDISTIIVGDGEFTFMPDFGMSGYEADLGSGPCPSTGLDHKKASQLPFNVVGPGTYCVSITREQTLDYWLPHYLRDGIWTEPRTNDVIAYQTVEVPPMTSDITVEFGWDEYDLVFARPNFEFTMECRFCPDPLGPVTGFLYAEQPVPIYAKDRASDWKLSEVEGMACYVLLSDYLLDQALAKMEGMEVRSADLQYYSWAPDCPEADKPDAPVDPCNQYSRATCGQHKCVWESDPGICVTP